MKRKYTRLRLELLLIGLISLAVSVLAGHAMAYWVDAKEGALYHFFMWSAQNLFGQTQESALLLYQSGVSDKWYIYALVAALLCMLVGSCLMLFLYTHRLKQLGGALRHVADGIEQPVELPKALSPLQGELDSLQFSLREWESQCRGTEQRRNEQLVYLAHDLKTPLTSVIGYLNLLRDDPSLTPEQRTKYTAIALDKAQRLQDLMLEFFDIAREGGQRQLLEPQDIQLSLLLEQLADEFLPQFQTKHLSCHTKIQPHLQVLGEADKLARVFDNVLRNAVSYSVEGGTVEIKAEKKGDWVVITISNRGLEIPEHELTKIFQKFYRLDSARSSRTGGAGLGLAIAREIVELHRGAIHAESNGQMTTFVIQLPFHRGQP